MGKGSFNLTFCEKVTWRSRRALRSYDYLFRAPLDVPHRWQHNIVGKGADAADTLSLRWIDSSAFESIDEEHRVALTPSYLPERFGLDHLR